MEFRRSGSSDVLEDISQKAKKTIVLIKTSIITERKPNLTEKTRVSLRKGKKRELASTRECVILLIHTHKF
jgi:hypothetical protein